MEEYHWYAAKVFFNKTAPIVSFLQSVSVHFYLPSDIIPSLLFIYSTPDFILDFQSKFYERLWIYSDRITRQPSTIPDREMQLFIFVTSAGKKGNPALWSAFSTFRLSFIASKMSKPSLFTT